ncbi:MAG: hypothetical protein M1819_003912 [Sarea resinae]|nr:MAG: hypothetical protein M1819_003912 [Sarea resinae]
MRFTSHSTLLALSSLSVLTDALPLSSPRGSKPQPPLRRAAAYSVVPVDGGSSSLSPTTTTEIQTITQSPSASSDTTDLVTTTEIYSTPQTVTSTVVSTTIIDGSTSETPVVVTMTDDGAVGAVPASSVTVGAPSESAEFLEPTPTLSLGPGPVVVPSVWTNSTTASAYLTLPTSTTAESYDNGQWHTYYPAWNASTTPVPTTFFQKRAVEATSSEEFPTLTAMTEVNSTEVPNVVLPEIADDSVPDAGKVRRLAIAPSRTSESWNGTDASLQIRAVASGKAVASGIRRRTIGSDVASAIPTGYVRRAIAAEGAVPSGYVRRASTPKPAMASGYVRRVISPEDAPSPTGYLHQRAVTGAYATLPTGFFAKRSWNVTGY